MAEGPRPPASEPRQSALERRREDAELSVETGVVWCYIHGYLVILIGGDPPPRRLQHLTTSAPGRCAYPRVVLLCPTSGELPTASGLYSRFSVVGTAQPVRADVAGARGRSYGEHTVLLVPGRQKKETEPAAAYLVAVEPVSSLRTLRLVAERLEEASDARRLDLTTTIDDVIGQLEAAVRADARLERLFQVVRYTTDDEAECKLRQLLQDWEQDRWRTPPTPARLSLGAYMAQSFLAGYLETMLKLRDVPSSLGELAAAEGLHMPLRKVMLICPTQLPGQLTAFDNPVQLLADFEDSQKLLRDVRPVRDVSGMTSDTPQLPAARSFGAFTLYRSKHSGDVYAVEVATPLRTIAAGIVHQVKDAAERRRLYQREAQRFVDELNSVMYKRSELAAQYTVVPVAPVQTLASRH